MSSTPAQRLAEILLGRTLENWVGERRAAGLSWQEVADALSAETEGQVSMNRETLRMWHKAFVGSDA